MSAHLPIPIAVPAYHVGMIHRAITTLQLGSELSQMRHRAQQVWIRQLRETSCNVAEANEKPDNTPTTARADRSSAHSESAIRRVGCRIGEAVSWLGAVILAVNKHQTGCQTRRESILTAISSPGPDAHCGSFIAEPGQQTVD